MGGIDDLIIVGDEAWTREEYEARQQKLARKRAVEKARRDADRPAYNAQQRAWRAANLERAREIRRESARRRRRALIDERRVPVAIGSLHDLGCTGPTRATGCRCKKIILLRPVEKVA